MPSLDAAERVVWSVLQRELGKVTKRASPDGALRKVLALTVAVVTVVDETYRVFRRSYPKQWRSIEASAKTFTECFVIPWIANGDAKSKKLLRSHRRRRLAARDGTLQLIEADRNKRGQWFELRLSADAPIPVSQKLAVGLPRLALAAQVGGRGRGLYGCRSTRRCSQERP